MDTSRVGDVSAARKALAALPENMAVVSMDGAFDSRNVYETVEDAGARPVMQDLPTAKAREVNARGRAIRRRNRDLAAWQTEYGRRVIVESGNYSLKRRFGDRLWTHRLRRQRKEMGLRRPVYNANMKKPSLVRVAITREGDVPRPSRGSTS